METSVEIWEDEPRAGTFLIAMGFERDHKHILEMVSRYEKDFEDFGRLKRRKSKSTGGRPVNEIMLNENQTMFLGTLLRNNEKSVLFKKTLVKKFDQCRKALLSIQSVKSQPDYKLTRDYSKYIRRETTDVMKNFVEYAKSQGSGSPEKYYCNITRMMNGMLFIAEGKFKNLKEVMTPRQLMAVCSAEQIIENGLEIGMRNKMFYKDVYKDVRQRVQTFADLHGQSKIIDRFLLESNPKLKQITSDVYESQAPARPVAHL